MRAEACLVVVQYLHQENAAFTFRTSLSFLAKRSESTKKLSPLLSRVLGQLTAKVDHLKKIKVP